jgi:hypothetical protein
MTGRDPRAVEYLRLRRARDDAWEAWRPDQSQENRDAKDAAYAALHKFLAANGLAATRLDQRGPLPEPDWAQTIDGGWTWVPGGWKWATPTVTGAGS